MDVPDDDNYLRALASWFNELHVGKADMSYDSFISSSIDSQIMYVNTYFQCTQNAFNMPVSAEDSLFGNIITQEYYEKRCHDILGYFDYE